MSFYDEVIRKDPRFGSTEAIRDLGLLEPVTRAAVQAMLATTAGQAKRLQVTETYRSQARQAQLFAQGKTQLQKVGVHGYGLAVDFVLINAATGAADWAAGDYAMLKGLAEANGLIWGGDWGDATIQHSFHDNDHVQRVNVSDQAGLFAGTWYPADDYRPVFK